MLTSLSGFIKYASYNKTESKNEIFEFLYLNNFPKYDGIEKLLIKNGRIASFKYLYNKE